MSAYDYAGNIERFTGFAGIYDDNRPSPPLILGEILPRIARVATPLLVVDLGCGTGLSTRFWADKAAQVIGIEPTDSMRDYAQSFALTNVSYRKGFSHDTGLDAHCAQIVTASQALHWMEPEGTFAEVARILMPGGVFAAYDYDWPPVTGIWEVDQAYETCMEVSRVLEISHGIADEVRRWDKASHLQRMEESGRFRYTREMVVHHIDQGNASRLLGLLSSQGHISSLRKLGVSDEELGVADFEKVVREHLGVEESEWVWSSRVRFGIV